MSRGVGSEAILERVHASTCWQNSAAPQTKWAFPCQYGPLTSLESLRQSQLQKDVGCQIQTQSVHSPKMRLILIILKESHKLLAICSSEEQTILSRCDTSELRQWQKLNVPTAPIYWQFLDQSNNSWDRGKNETCHTHTSLDWLLQCSTNRKRGLLSNSLPPLCYYKTVPELLALAAHADGGITCSVHSPWASTKALVCEYTCRK